MHLFFICPYKKMISPGAYLYNSPLILKHNLQASIPSCKSYLHQCTFIMRTKTYVILSLALMSCFAYCTPKIGAVANDTPLKDSYSAEELEKGKVVMTNTCANCHVLFEPQDFTAGEWNEILKSMIPKAKLQGEDAELVKAYIVHNAKAEQPGTSTH